MKKPALARPSLRRLLFAITAIGLLTASGLFLRLWRPKTPVTHTPRLQPQTEWWKKKVKEVGMTS